jgi:hypothetical protein
VSTTREAQEMRRLRRQSGGDREKGTIKKKKTKTKMTTKMTTTSDRRRATIGNRWLRPEWRCQVVVTLGYRRR